MTDDNDAFTFVDKRKTSADVAEAEVSSEPVDYIQNPSDDSLEETEETPVSEDGEAASEGKAPDVYMLISYALQMFITTAWQRLGLWADPASGEVAADLDQAKVAIDVVSDLVAKLESAPESSVPERDRRELKRILNDLRMNYVSRRSVG